MTHTYTVTGMTCTGCQAKVKGLLSQVPGVKNVQINLALGQAGIESDKLIPAEELRSALKDYPKYQLHPDTAPQPHPGTLVTPHPTAAKSWFTTYKPILLIFSYILVISIVSASVSASFDPALAMRVFMAGFFLTFSFFKMLDLKGFAESYAMYDIIARRFKNWGYIYAFIELILGLSYALNVRPFLTNVVTFLVMLVSMAGVLQSVLNKRKIKCACLGAVFDLPMSTVTIIEDGSMILLSALFLAHFIHF